VNRTLAVSLAAAAAVGTIAIGSTAGQATAGQAATGHSQTLKMFDKPQSTVLTKADGSVVTHAPYPQPKKGDVLAVDSLDYRGTHAKHAKHWVGSTHLECTFSGHGAPDCRSEFAIGGSLLMFTGDPGTVADGTGIYQGASGHVASDKEFAHNTSDIVVRITLRG
jgi:hypothetical protein